MVFDGEGNLYVSDFNGSQIVKFDSNGNPVDGGIFVPSGSGGLNNPGGIAFSEPSVALVPDNEVSLLETLFSRTSSSGGSSSPSLVPAGFDSSFEAETTPLVASSSFLG